MSLPAWMIYGANGYSGELIAREAKKKGLSPILAGRREERIRPLAEELGFAWKAFSLDNMDALTELKDIDLVLHCAGPFSATSEPMVSACLKAGAHYLDITGEISVFEAVGARNLEAEGAGVVLCPGVGFDVIPTDCVAACLKAAMPDASHLTLGFDSRSQLSPGTAKTSVEGISQGVKWRRNGTIETARARFRNIDFGNGEKEGMMIPWGDVSTAFQSTGIPNIEVYMGITPAQKKQMASVGLLRPLLKLGFVQGYLKRRIERTVKGPAEGELLAYQTSVWGEVRNAAGDHKVARIKTANGYLVTRDGALAITEHLLNGSDAKGAMTPSKLMGAHFVETLPGSSQVVIT